MEFSNNTPSSQIYCDEILWTDFRRGDRKAFANLYCRYCGIMITNSLRLHSDKTFIEDCVHDLFIEIWNNKANLGIPRSVKAYLICSVQRKIIRRLKQKRVEVLSGTGYIMQEVQVESIEEKVVLEQHYKERKCYVEGVIKQLTRREQEAVLLKFYANLSYPEIADKMYISTNAIYNLISKAISQMADKLEMKVINN